MEISFGINKKYWRKNQPKGAHTLATRVEGAATPLGRALCPCGPPGPPPASTPYIHVRGEKIREKDSSRFTIQSRRQALNLLGGLI